MNDVARRELEGTVALLERIVGEQRRDLTVVQARLAATEAQADTLRGVLREEHARVLELQRVRDELGLDLARERSRRGELELALVRHPLPAILGVDWARGPDRGRVALVARDGGLAVLLPELEATGDVGAAIADELGKLGVQVESLADLAVRGKRA